ncbi:MAG: uncharacterized protein A8A55_1939 [Amphiamblys sp. WSBS2006]|nr:MAG: uncharacterized protein A8A55_1939 [Amphiamblys sp. WSBS2006]
MDVFSFLSVGFFFLFASCEDEFTDFEKLMTRVDTDTMKPDFVETLFGVAKQMKEQTDTPTQEETDQIKGTLKILRDRLDTMAKGESKRPITQSLVISTIILCYLTDDGSFDEKLGSYLKDIYTKMLLK